MKIERPYIVYSLSKERTTQAMTSRKLNIAWEAIKHFIDTYTEGDAEKPDSIELTAYTAYEKADPLEMLHKIIKDTQAIFGEGEFSEFVTSPEGITTNRVLWKLRNEQLQQVINYLHEGQPWVKSSFGPLELVFSYSFNLLDLKTKQQLPNQQLKSDILIWFSRSTACSATLFFPFVEPSLEFWKYVEDLKKVLPFKLEEKYLRLARINKDGRVTSFKKIERLIV